MHAKILAFPARSCRFSVVDRCAKDDILHPIGSSRLQCRVLTAWENAHSGMLDTAEQYRLTLEESMTFIAENTVLDLEPVLLCPQYRRAGTNSELDCIFLHGHLCIRALPSCTGACRSFALRSSGLPKEPEHH
ncbi:hypothetical protein SAMN05660653_01250 [Desulfonatronum thiosulfatophilum]|uniref:Uncharacterized protein n=1 Tax=Desulfonatronum thiosulfatophilum TaxID=617002 RepID=A0A1G6C016_9BACT|nr:hypothetical protein [Desulfonatronum thiosulfatophilum]SDB26196.1 hypothetical protein SAMN05660653_01250 [Desulfonatronum thiosulfatophilum]